MHERTSGRGPGAAAMTGLAIGPETFSRELQRTAIVLHSGHDDRPGLRSRRRQMLQPQPRPLHDGEMVASAGLTERVERGASGLHVHAARPGIESREHLRFLDAAAPGEPKGQHRPCRFNDRLSRVVRNLVSLLSDAQVGTFDATDDSLCMWTRCQ